MVSENKLIDSLDKKEKQQIQFENELERMAEVFSEIDPDEEIAKCANAITAWEQKVEARNTYIESRISGELLSVTRYGEVNVVELKDHKFGLFDNKGYPIVPFGKYAFIDGFEYGLARVRSQGKTTYSKNIVGIFNVDSEEYIHGKEAIESFIHEDVVNNPKKYSKWGIINTKGEEVLPVEYDEVWNFFGKNRYSTTVKQGKNKEEIWFHDLNPEAPIAPWLLKKKHFNMVENPEDYIDDALEGYSKEYLGID